MPNPMVFEIESRSSGAAYTVKLWPDPLAPVMTCTCPAGEQGQPCKHRFALIDGDARDVTCSTHDVAEVARAIEGTALAQALIEMREMEDTVKKAQAALKAMKASVARQMRGQV